MLSGGIKEGQLVLRTKIIDQQVRKDNVKVKAHCVKTTIIAGFTIIRPSENTRKNPQQNPTKPTKKKYQGPRHLQL